MTFDTPSTGSSGGTGLTISHTVGSGTDRILVVSISCQDSNHANLPVTSVTFNGVALTRPDGGFIEPVANVRAEQWFLVNPDSGTHDIIITTTGSVWKGAVAISWDEAKQTDQPNAINSASGNSSAPSVNVTPDVDDAVTIDALSSEAASNSTGADQTSLGTEQGQSFENVKASREGPTNPAATVTMSHGLGSGAAWAIVAASYAPTAAGTVQRTKTFTADGVIKVTNTQTFTVDGIVSGLFTRYMLNDTGLPRPKTFKREFIMTKSDFLSINGRTTRDISSFKEEFILGFTNLSINEVQTIMNIINLNTPVIFSVNDGELQINQTTVIPYVNQRRYRVPGGSYFEELELTLIEVS